MALTFDGLTIYGVHSAIDRANPDYHRILIEQFGNSGAVVSYGGVKSATVNVPILIHNNYSKADIQAALTAIDRKVGVVGTLATVGEVTSQRTWTYTLLESIENQPLGNVKDILYTANLGYVFHAMLGFRFMRPF